jgi:hypothetical protein
MTTQRITKLSPYEATTEAAGALAAANLAGFRISTSPQQVGRQGKVVLMTVASGSDAQAALSVLRNLPDVTSSGTMGRSTAYIYRRLI